MSICVPSIVSFLNKSSWTLVYNFYCSLLNFSLIHSETEEVANLPILASVQTRKLRKPSNILINLTLTRLELPVRFVVYSITIFSLYQIIILFNIEIAISCSHKPNRCLRNAMMQIFLVRGVGIQQKRTIK